MFAVTIMMPWMIGLSMIAAFAMYDSEIWLQCGLLKLASVC